MSNFKGKKDISEPTSSSADDIARSQPLRPKSVIGPKSRPSSAARSRKDVKKNNAESPDHPVVDVNPGLPAMNGHQVFVSDKPEKLQTKEANNKDAHVVKDRRPVTGRRNSARPVRSQSASGPRRNKPAQEKTAQNGNLQLTTKGQGLNAASESDDERLSRLENDQQTYAERVAVMKENLLKKMLNKVDLDSKLKDFKKANKGQSEKSKSSGRRSSEPNVGNGNRSTEETKENDIPGDVSKAKKDICEDPLDPEVETWLIDNELYDNERCRNVFKKHKITMSQLKNMTDAKFRILGVTNAIALSKIRIGLLRLKTEGLGSSESKGSVTTSKGVQNDIETENKAEKEDAKLENDSDEKLSSDNKEAGQTLQKVVNTSAKVPYIKPAWGSNQGSRASLRNIKPRSRPTSAGPTPRLRPSSAANSRQNEAKRSVAPARPRTGLAFKQESAKQKENKKNSDDSVTSRSGSGEDKDGKANRTDRSEHPNLQVAGAPVTSPASPGRRGAGTLVPVGQKDTAQSALETMEQQIQILQQQASTTGDGATAAMVAQLQEQLHQVQRAMEEGQQPSVTPRTEQASPPEHGSFISAALAGNVRPLSCRGTGPGTDDTDGATKDPKQSVKPPTPSGSTFRTRGAASDASAKSSAMPLNMSMSKQAILKEVRKKTEEHRRTVKHLESELSRLKHKDPLRNSEVDEEDVSFNENSLIGEGAFSQVFHGMFQGAEVAIKRLKVPLTAQDKNYFIAEVNLLRELRHPRVVLLMGVCTSSHLPLMVLEFMDGGSLYGHLHDKNSDSLDHAAYYLVAQDIAVGMNYLHRHRPAVLHLDLKSMNVLLTAHLRAKIADFGFSKLRHDAELAGSQRTGSVKGTPAWMAPELLEAGDITTKADVYSYGIILWEMLTRQKPYDGCSIFQVIERVRNKKRPELPDSCPPELAKLIMSCWHHLPGKRPAFQEVLMDLEALHFPPGWKSLFAAAGVPKVALDDVEMTRTLIDIVSQTLETGHTPQSEAADLNTGNNPCYIASIISTPKGSDTGVAVLSTTPSQPPPPPPLPPPPLPIAGQNMNKGALEKPPTGHNFLGQLKADLQEVKLKPAITQQSTGYNSFSGKSNMAATRPAEALNIDPNELQSWRQKLKPTEQPHPNQLRDLSGMSQGAMAGIADVIRRAVNERRVALNEVNSVDQSYTDSGWSIDAADMTYSWGYSPGFTVTPSGLLPQTAFEPLPQSSSVDTQLVTSQPKPSLPTAVGTAQFSSSPTPTLLPSHRPDALLCPAPQNATPGVPTEPAGVPHPTRPVTVLYVQPGPSPEGPAQLEQQAVPAQPHLIPSAPPQPPNVASPPGLPHAPAPAPPSWQDKSAPQMTSCVVSEFPGTRPQPGPSEPVASIHSSSPQMSDTQIGQSQPSAAVPSSVPPAPPPPPPPPAPPMPQIGQHVKNSSGGKPQTGGSVTAEDKPSASVTLMEQLKSNLKDIKLKPTSRESPAKSPSTPTKVVCSPTRPAGAEGFTVDASELQSLRQQLKPTGGQLHKDQLRGVRSRSRSPASRPSSPDVQRRGGNKRGRVKNKVKIDDRSFTYSGLSGS